jgi:D-arabinose 1-dehydrogenase-like Zn-dependent alcohol dehydrogenase
MVLLQRISFKYSSRIARYATHLAAVIVLRQLAGHNNHCESCRRGDFATCKYAQVPGISYDGGYADYMIAPIEALA